MRAFLTCFRGDAVGIESDLLDPQVLPQPDLPSDAAGTDGCLRVEWLLDAIARDESLRGFRPLVVATTCDLAKDGCAALWGYADPVRQIAVVSTYRLKHDDPARLRARLENLIRHEIGHLRGWRHCKIPGCLMCPARNMEELDARGGEDCPHAAPRRKAVSPLWHRACACGFLLLAFVAINLAGMLLKRPKKAPFALLGAGDAREVLAFNGLPVHDSSALVDPERVPDELNRLFRMVDPPKLVVVPAGEREAVLMTPDREMLRLRDEKAALQADQLAGQLNDLIAAKGSRSSLCAQCHLNRKPEVLEAAYGRKWNISLFGSR